METESRRKAEHERLVQELTELLCDVDNSMEARVDAAVELVRVDAQTAERHIMYVLTSSEVESFDFRSELLDVMLSHWINHNNGAKATAFLRQVSEPLRSYGERACRNLKQVDE